MIRVKMGVPRLEGSYEIELYFITLRDGIPDSNLFTKEFVVTMNISVL